MYPTTKHGYIKFWVPYIQLFILGWIKIMSYEYIYGNMEHSVQRDTKLEAKFSNSS